MTRSEPTKIPGLKASWKVSIKLSVPTALRVCVGSATWSQRMWCPVVLQAAGKVAGGTAACHWVKCDVAALFCISFRLEGLLDHEGSIQTLLCVLPNFAPFKKNVEVVRTFNERTGHWQHSRLRPLSVWGASVLGHRHRRRGSNLLFVDA